MTSDEPNDARRHAPATTRNREFILGVLRRHLPPRGLVLEIASGSGEHAAYFAQQLPHLSFQPTDPSPAALASTDAWTRELGLHNVAPALPLDAAAADWPISHADAILCINMIHISPWTATLGLMSGAARILPAGALLYLYGPYQRGGRHTSPSNARFDEDLRRQNPQWGVRDLEAVVAAGEAAGFAPPTVEDMPANNLSVIFRRCGP